MKIKYSVGCCRILYEETPQLKPKTSTAACPCLFLVSLYFIASICLEERSFKRPSGFLSLNLPCSSEPFVSPSSVYFTSVSNPCVFISACVYYQRVNKQSLDLDVLVSTSLFRFRVFRSVKCCYETCVSQSEGVSPPCGQRDYQHLRRSFPKPADPINLN